MEQSFSLFFVHLGFLNKFSSSFRACGFMFDLVHNSVGSLPQLVKDLVVIGDSALLEVDESLALNKLRNTIDVVLRIILD